MSDTCINGFGWFAARWPTTRKTKVLDNVTRRAGAPIVGAWYRQGIDYQQNNIKSTTIR
jgi:hypothetical protein